MTKKHLYDAATTLLTRNLRFSTLQAWGLKLAKASGFIEGKDRCGTQDGRDPARHVEDQHPIPLGPGSGDIVTTMPLH